ncbi:hypothetical protein GCM10027294_13790 [Marinactinospora endophytica]
MSSSPLYVAIVVVWIIVLIPMMLRRDATDPAPESLRRNTAKDGDGDATEEGAADEVSPDAVETQVIDYDSAAVVAARAAAARAGEDPEEEAEARSEAPPQPQISHGRARVIARRRRRTAGLATLFTVTALAVIAELGPWWVVLPPAGLLLGHLALLREAAKADAEQRMAEAEYLRRREMARARRQAAAAREAEVIELAGRRDEVYDQYTDAQLRAAGD